MIPVSAKDPVLARVMLDLALLYMPDAFTVLNTEKLVVIANQMFRFSRLTDNPTHRHFHWLSPGVVKGIFDRWAEGKLGKPRYLTPIHEPGENSGPHRYRLTVKGLIYILETLCDVNGICDLGDIILAIDTMKKYPAKYIKKKRKGHLDGILRTWNAEAYKTKIIEGYEVEKDKCSVLIKDMDIVRSEIEKHKTYLKKATKRVEKAPGIPALNIIARELDALIGEYYFPGMYAYRARGRPKKRESIDKELYNQGWLPVLLWLKTNYDAESMFHYITKGYWEEFDLYQNFFLQKAESDLEIIEGL